MASIFTFDPEPPRVASPWLRGTATNSTAESSPAIRPTGDLGPDAHGVKEPLLSRLEAEPQEGPTEYKLHLLLRARRAFVKSTTGGLLHRHGGQPPTIGPGDLSRSNSEDVLSQASPPQSSSTISRQSRLQQLTTQLLWRLQQSSPNHSSSYSAAVIPRFSDLEKGNSSPRIQPIVPGLEESQGALYEIGVADDGALIGLCEDEMDESVSNLRIMAASLGCVVSILRMVSVGHCEWLDDEGELHKDVLWVSEAYVRPSLAHENGESTGLVTKGNEHVLQSASHSNDRQHESTEQVRISLTGATMSGKSSLLGSLTTATLDNGRGKSRLSLLKHRHEIVTGMTSSVTQELIGYNKATGATSDSEVRIVNYASGHVSSWVDIHGLSRSGRLCLLSDSAGHLRYRRTTMRGLIGWAPHWTFLCVPADNTEDTSGMTGSTPPPQEVLGVSDLDIDLSEANLELCLRLDLPLVIVVTKLDLASRLGLRSCLAKVLSTLKRAGRRPVLISDGPADVKSTRDKAVIPASDVKAIEDVLGPLHDDPLSVVPIIMTSAVNGTGISKVHALLHALPLCKLPSTQDDQQLSLEKVFHVEDVYAGKGLNLTIEQQPVVLSGYVQSGAITIGDTLSLGPFSIDPAVDSDESTNSHNRPQIPTSRSFPGALSHLARFRQNAGGANIEWRQAKVVSLRNLRLPVRTLLPDQVGTIGVVLTPVGTSIVDEPVARVRKGMILASGEPRACTTFDAAFERADVESLSIRSSVVVYTDSVRASARVIAGAVHPADDHHEDIDEQLGSLLLDGDDRDFDKDDDVEDHDGARNHRPLPGIVVTFQFIASREFIRVGGKVMVMPGGGPGLFGGLERGAKGMAGLEGFVGRILNVSS